MLKLAERMVLSFCSGVRASTVHKWTTLSGSGVDDVRVMTSKSMDDPSRPPGVVLSVATSFSIPIQPKWDILLNGGLVQEMAHITNSRNPGKCVSLFRVNVSFAFQCSVAT
ncbi:hypothetical protein Tco_0041064 [Tanacetum coccineum]